MYDFELHTKGAHNTIALCNALQRVIECIARGEIDGVLTMDAGEGSFTLTKIEDDGEREEER